MGNIFLFARRWGRFFWRGIAVFYDWAVFSEIK